jgi:hypothetical protein
MIKIFQIGLLCLLILLLGYEDGKAASPTKPTSKDSEFNDPLLDEEADAEAELEAREKQELDARGNTPLEENVIPEPPPVTPKSAEVDQTPSLKDDGSAKSSNAGRSSIESQNSKVSTESATAGDTLAEGEVETTDPKKDQLNDNPSSTAALPRWNPQSSHRGFVGIDEDGGYLYKEESDGGAREYKDDLKVVPSSRNYKRGLLRVTSDGSYVYKGEESEKEGSASIRMAQMPPLPLERQLETTTITYEDIYGDKPVGTVLIDYDWLTFRKFGQWILSFGTGIGQVEGPGRFLDDGTKASERYTLYVLLNHISFTYRFQYTAHPWVVPYFSGGGVPAILYEHRDDNKRNKSKFIPAAQASGGVRLNIGNFDTYGAASIDAEYGINNLWLDVEFRRVQGFSKEIDISSNLINLGLGFDF